MDLSWEPGPLSCCRGWALRIVAHGLPGNVTLPGPGIEPVFPALAGRFLTPGPPGKSLTLTMFQVRSGASGTSTLLCSHCQNLLVFPAGDSLLLTPTSPTSPRP